MNITIESTRDIVNSMPVEIGTRVKVTGIAMPLFGYLSTVTPTNSIDYTLGYVLITDDGRYIHVRERSVQNTYSTGAVRVEALIDDTWKDCVWDNGELYVESRTSEPCTVTKKIKIGDTFAVSRDDTVYSAHVVLVRPNALVIEISYPDVKRTELVAFDYFAENPTQALKSHCNVFTLVGDFSESEYPGV